MPCIGNTQPMRHDVSHCLVAYLNTLRPRQNGRRFADDTFNRIFLNENVRISIKISLKFVPRGPINNISALVQIMAWRRPGDKPLSEPMMVSLPTHICVTRPQSVNWLIPELAVYGTHILVFKEDVCYTLRQKQNRCDCVQTAFSNEFSRIKIIVYCSKFHQNLFAKV